MKKETIKLEVVNHNAAGIDIGSASHYVAVGQNLSDVKEFGISHSDHLKLDNCHGKYRQLLAKFVFSFIRGRL
jgi:transposase